jgi:hypothetical protein
VYIYLHWRISSPSPHIIGQVYSVPTMELIFSFTSYNKKGLHCTFTCSGVDLIQVYSVLLPAIELIFYFSFYHWIGLQCICNGVNLLLLLLSLDRFTVNFYLQLNWSSPSPPIIVQFYSVLLPAIEFIFSFSSYHCTGLQGTFTCNWVYLLLLLLSLDLFTVNFYLQLNWSSPSPPIIVQFYSVLLPAIEFIFSFSSYHWTGLQGTFTCNWVYLLLLLLSLDRFTVYCTCNGVDILLLLLSLDRFTVYLQWSWSFLSPPIIGQVYSVPAMELIFSFSSTFLLWLFLTLE